MQCVILSLIYCQNEAQASFIRHILDIKHTTQIPDPSFLNTLFFS